MGTFQNLRYLIFVAISVVFPILRIHLIHALLLFVLLILMFVESLINTVGS